MPVVITNAKNALKILCRNSFKWFRSGLEVSSCELALRWARPKARNILRHPRLGLFAGDASVPTDHFSSVVSKRIMAGSFKHPLTVEIFSAGSHLLLVRASQVHCLYPRAHSKRCLPRYQIFVKNALYLYETQDNYVAD